MATELYLHGIGHFHPENVIDNDFLESLDTGVDADWILRRVGIRTRRTVLPLEYIRAEKNKSPAAADEAALYTNAQLGAKAARLALQRAGVGAADIGLVISGSSAQGTCSPAESCVIAAELGIEAPAFDLNSACATFAAQIWTISRMNLQLSPDFVLLLQPESLTRTVNYADRGTSVLMGDCATAAVVSAKVKSPVQIGFNVLHSNPIGWNAAVIPARGHFRLNGSAVQRFAIRKTIEVLEGLAPHASTDSWFIGHQANLPMLMSVCEKLQIPDYRHLYNIDEFGNCGSAGAPSVLSAHWGRFLAGGDLRMAVVGAGLTWAGVVFHSQSQATERLATSLSTNTAEMKSAVLV